MLTSSSRGGSGGSGGDFMISSYSSLGRPIVRTKVYDPHEWAEIARLYNPVRNLDGWFCHDGDVCVRMSSRKKKNRKQQQEQQGLVEPLPVIGSCRVCLQSDAHLFCSQCCAIVYCSKGCQRQHWRESHKKACLPNPKPYTLNTDLRQFHGLSPADVEGHEFITIRATDRLLPHLDENDNNNSKLLISAICEHVLESADDIFDIPGFSVNQLDVIWTAQDVRHHLISQAMVTKFGWTSGAHSVESVDGYRIAEDKTVYKMLHDKDFLKNPQESTSGLAQNYYGQPCCPYNYYETGKDVHGNLVIFKLALPEKRRIPPVTADALGRPIDLPTLDLDDCFFEFTFAIMPVCKAEIAHMLLERRKAASQGAFSRRLWRSRIRLKEISQSAASC